MPQPQVVQEGVLDFQCIIHYPVINGNMAHGVRPCTPLRRQVKLATGIVQITHVSYWDKHLHHACPALHTPCQYAFTSRTTRMTWGGQHKERCGKYLLLSLACERAA
ncbi:unnamed protein product [Polarella glacialis]|uniref:Uncharacterized protein n=1 Tax=Polarella glacialis TaxID=89957 RepID=A0A813FR91_POLGL|nr:unnamed protein product [Polarella glacialis]